MMIDSDFKALGRVIFPEYKGIRAMMMPFLVDDPVGSMPADMRGYAEMIAGLDIRLAGVGYVTIDEGVMAQDEHQRRPGLHVDGGPASSWGGGGGGWAGRSGMLLASTNRGCKVWRATLEADFDEQSGCEHLRSKLGEGFETRPGEAYWLSTYAIHETLGSNAGPRQFIRVSMPSDAPWFDGYTVNPLGVLPTGPILPRRKQMDYRH
jgi:hypothetical protein